MSDIDRVLSGSDTLGLSNNAPRTGTAVSATKKEADNAKHTVKANGKKKEPTSPWIKASGTKTAIVVRVEANMAGATSLVASSAA